VPRRRGHGEGSIRKRGDGRYEGTLSLGWSGGKRVRKSFYGSTRAEVQARLLDAAQKLQNGVAPVGESLTLEAFLEGWLADIRPSIRPRTWQRYEQYVRLHLVPGLGKVKLARLTPDHLQRHYAERLASGLSAQSVVHMHRVLHQALARAVRFGQAQRNVAAMLLAQDLPKIAKHQMQALSVEQVRVLLAAAAHDRLEALYVLAVTTGMREGELLGLHWAEVNLDAGFLAVRYSLGRTPSNTLEIGETKTDKSRRAVYLTGPALDALRRHRARQVQERLLLGPDWPDLDLVFTNSLGKPINASNLLRRSYYPLLERAGLPRIRFHELRHTAATLLLGEKVDVKVVSEMLGHSETSITRDLYQHVTLSMQQDAVRAMDRLVGNEAGPIESIGT
jgi:integrase